MAIDTSMYSQLRAPQMESPTQMMGNAMKLSDLMDQRQDRKAAREKQQTLKDIYQRNTVQNEDGSTDLNRKAVLSDLYKVDPQLAMKTESGFKADKAKAEQMDFESRKRQLETAKDLAWSVRDPQSYQAMRQKAQELGLPNANQLPPEYDPGYVRQMQMGTLKASEQLAQQNKNRSFDMQKQNQQFSQSMAKQDQAMDREKFEYKKQYDQEQMGFNREKEMAKALEKYQTKLDKKNSLKIEGMDIMDGAQPTTEDAKKVKAALVQRKNILASLDKLETLVDSEGTEAFSWGNESGEMSQLATDARMGAKDLYELGVLAGPDMELLESVIPDPSDIGWAVTPKSADKVKKRLQRAKKIMEEKTKNIAETRGYRERAEGPPPLAKNQNVQRFRTDEIEWAD